MTFVEAVEAIRRGKKVTAPEMLRDCEHWAMKPDDRGIIERHYYADAGNGWSVPHGVTEHMRFETDMIYWSFTIYVAA